MIKMVTDIVNNTNDELYKLKITVIKECMLTQMDIV